MSARAGSSIPATIRHYKPPRTSANKPVEEPITAVSLDITVPPRSQDKPDPHTARGAGLAGWQMANCRQRARERGTQNPSTGFKTCTPDPICDLVAAATLKAGTSASYVSTIAVGVNRDRSKEAQQG